MDKTSTSDDKDVKNTAKVLWEDDVEVIPIPFGSEADKNELKSITPHDKNVIPVDMSNKTSTIAEKIMDKVRKAIPMIDLAFAISSNAAGSDETFKKIKDAIGFIITYYGADRIQYAVIRFGSSSFADISFQDVKTVDELREQIDQMSRAFGVPNLKEALEKAKDVFNNAPDRTRAKKFLVVVMDTKSSNGPDEVKQGAEPLEKEGIKVIPVAIGTDADPSELEKVTSNRQNMIKSPKSEEAKSLGKKIVKTIVKDHPPVEKVDMIIAISSTATRGEENFKKAKDVIQSIITEYGRERLHYGVVLFGKPPRTVVRLSDYYDTDEQLMAVINTFPRDTGSADLAEAVKSSWDMFSREARPDAKKVLIVISDKKSESTDNELDEAVKPLVKNNVIVIPVALGVEADEKQLKTLTEDESTLVTADTSNDTADITMKIMDQVFKERISIPEMDLLFAISTTSTESDANMAYIKNVIYKIIDKYGIRKIKYSLLTFGQEPFVHFKFNFISDEVNRLKTAIERSKMKSSGSPLEKAMEGAKKVFEEAEGRRPDAKKVLVVITDKKSDSDEDGIRQAAVLLENNNIRVIPVALGSEADVKELTNATLDEDDVVKADTNDDPEETADKIIMKAKSPGIPEMNICFAMSTFDSDADETFKKMKEAVKNIIDKYKDYDQIHYSILPFGTAPSSVTAFGEQFDSLDKLMEYIMSIPRPSGRPDVIKALERAEEVFDNAPLRPRAKKFLVVFVGSKSGNDLEKLKMAAKPLEDKMIKVISVAVGPESDPNELIKIVPNKGNLIKGDKIYNDSDKLGDEVMDIVFKDLPIIPEVDLAFAISANAAQSGANFQKMTDVIAEVVEMYGTERIHYSVIVFGSVPSVKIRFNDVFPSDENLKTRIKLFNRASGSGLDAALQKAKEIFESYARPGVRRVLVVITDKKSDSSESEVRIKVSLLEQAKIKVIPVGLGDEVDNTELDVLTPRKDDVIKKPDDVPSKDLTKDIMKKVLEESIFVPEMDLAFVISTTAVDQDKNFEKTKEIVKGTVEKFGLIRVRYSLITFGATPDVKIRFDNVFDTTEELGKLVDNVKKAVGDAALHKALEEVRYLFAQAEDARPNASKVLVVITDKTSDSTEDDVQVAAKKLKDDGVRVIAIALGDEFDPVSPEVIKPEEKSTPENVVKELVDTVLNDSVITDKIDLGFAISTTALNAADTFKKMKETVKTIIRKYGVGNLRYAVIIYGSDAKVAIGFDSTFPSLDNWLTTVDGLQIEQGTPAMEKALQEAKKLFELDARSDAKKVLVVIADKSPIGDEKVIKKEARDLDIDDVKVVPVSVGDGIDPKELEDISPYKDVLVDVPKDVDPTDLAETIMDKVLKVTPKVPKLDLAFAISALPTDNNFGLILDVVKEVTQRFFSEKVKYGLIVFGRDASVKIRFSDKYTDPKKLEMVIGTVPSNNAQPNLDKALVLAKTLFESEASRKDAQKVLVVITDASTGSDKPAIEKAAKDLIKGAIVVLPVAIGDKPVPDLEKEFPDEEVVKANDTDHPIKIADKIQDRLLDDRTRFPRLDIAFVVSATAVTADDNFKLIKSTIVSIIEEHGVKKHLYALVVFGQYANITRTFQKAEEETLISLVKGAQLPTGEPNIVYALETTKQLFFDPSGGARPDSRKIVVIMIDRKSVNTESDIERVAGVYEDNKVKFVTVVVGAEADPTELVPFTPDKKNDSIVTTDKDEDPSDVAKGIWDMMGLALADPCWTKKCDFNAKCVLYSNGTTGCVCREKCLPSYSPICASNKKTYPNNCSMTAESCRTKTNIIVTRDGVCEACNNSVDLLFALAGGDISVKKNFIQSIVDKFVVGGNDTRVGIVAVGFLNDTVLPLDALESQSSLHSYFVNDNGSLPSITEFLRPDVGKALVVITFLGEGNIALLQSLSGTLKARDAAVFVVGVGRGMDDPTVKNIASKEDYAYHATSYYEIMPAATNISDQICNLEVLVTYPIDIAFAISATSTNANELFDYMKDAITYIIDKYGMYYVHYAFMVFGSQPDYQVTFGERFNSTDKLKSLLDNIARLRGQPNLGKALEKASEIFQPGYEGERPGVRKFLVVIVDRNTVGEQNVILRHAKILENSEIKVIPVAVGQDVDPDGISIPPNEDKVITDPTPEVDKPETLAENIMARVLIDACNFTECAYYAECISLRDGTARCACAEVCPASFHPVCGSNSRRFWNECFLRREACFMRLNTTVLSELPCNPSPCYQVTCPFYGTCRLKEDRTPYCACPNSCPEIYRPVCGSDGRSYFSECFLQSNACRIRKRITVKYRGHCNPCKNVSCDYHAKCSALPNDTAVCQCVDDCTAEPFKPVCGSDMVTYLNKCALKARACREKKMTTVKSSGICQKAVDLAFVIGASGPKASINFARMVTILKKIVDEYETSQSKTLLALVDYNGPAYARVFLSDRYHKDNFKMFAENIPGPTSRPGTLRGALKKVREEVFTLQRGDRPFAEDILVVMTDGDFDKNSPEIKNEISKLRDRAVKVFVVAIADDPDKVDKHKFKVIASGDNLVVIPKPDKDEEEGKKLPFTATKKYHDCAEVKTSGYSSDGHYLIQVSDRCQDPIRVYCHNMSSGMPREFITLESGAENNYAVIYHERLQDRFACSGPARTELYAERGATNFTKVRLDLATMKLISNDFTFAQTRGGRDVGYGTAGDCYSVNPGNCRKGSFKVDLLGTRLRVRDDVTWSLQGFPMGLEIQDYNRSHEGAVVSAKCGGWCSRCKPTRGAILVEPLCSLPAACPFPMDVVFALDSSYDLKPSDFDKQKSFVLSMINGFTISKSKTQVGLITVSETARKDIELTEYSQPGLLKARVAGLPVEKVIPSIPTSRLRDMLRKALGIFKNGGRSGVPKSLIVIVVGEITEDLETSAASLKNRDIQIFVVAVGVSSPSSRHLSLASGSDHVHTVSSVDELQSLSATLIKDTCEDPCRKRDCELYSRCKAIDHTDSECVCPKMSDCPPTQDEVCGSDGKTYDNDCALRVEACAKGEDIAVTKLGPCGLCAGVKCKDNARCEVKDEKAQCLCKDARECPQTSAPVCGHDNNTYINRCYLDVANCSTDEDINEKRTGKCEPCADVKCKEPKTCVVDSRGNPECICPDERDCPSTVHTVCGSDNKTYLNDCVMKAKACEKNMSIDVVMDGYCGPCDLAKDCKNNAVCIGNFDGSVTCKCRTEDECPKDGDGVCGSDGQTYINKCQLDAVACANNNEIQQRHEGPCGSCNPNSCRDNEVCIGRKDGSPSCKCIETKDCPKEKDPVCGTDGKTYLNECMLKAKSCGTNTSVVVKHPGTCVVCKDIRCSDGKRCVSTIVKLPTCQCPTEDDCPRDLDPVCGSDKKTYINLCRLRVETCKTGQPLVVDKKGVCDPCQAARCLHHARCVNKPNGSTACECPRTDDCPDDADPVCGTDGKTYDNECKLKAQSCEKGEDVTMKHKGNCGPCSFSDCEEYYGTCTVGQDGSGTAQCKCPVAEECSNSTRAVCGDDGKTYSNRCRLEAESCELKKRIEIKDRGQCTPCSKPTCSKDQDCTVDAQGKAVCGCPKQCPSLGEPVCGSDGRTYENECKARKESCDKKKGLSIKSGACGLVVNPCSLKTCTNNALCAFKSGSVECRCPDMNDCSTVRNPVCGSDGSTHKVYANLCIMEAESCKMGKRISPVIDDKCASCNSVNCANYATCKVRNNKAVCVCPSEEDCPWKVDLICGSDGQSYINECVMRAKSCKAGKNVTRKRKGYCGICDLVKCPGSSQCFIKENGLHECRCPQEDECPSSGEKVCGSDGVTYDNECKLKAAACEALDGLVLMKEGSCDSCTGMECQHNQVCKVVKSKATCQCPEISDCGYTPALVCGSDRNEYPNECLLKVKSCLAASGLVLSNKGKCVGGCSLIKCSIHAICHNSPDGTPTCVCPKKEDCPASVKPVCGSDGRTYINECLMKVVACENNKDTEKTKDGLCDPCKFASCTNHTKCEVQPDNSTECVCQSREECPDTVEPVCGSDRKTYGNKCLFKVEACRSDMTVKQGRCDACSFHKCKSYQDCVVENDAAKCQCPRRCPSPNEPVCANNGKSYPSECAMRVKACKIRKELLVVRKGSCDACSLKRCALYETCIIDINNQPKCVCPSPLQCLRGQRASPVCGSDGRTYFSECVLRAENCGKRPKALLQFRGECGLVVLPCSSTSCNFGSRCSFTRGYPECVCPLESDCPAENKPVCGSDGQNYPNECVLTARACLNRKDVVAEYEGPCVACLLANCERFFARCQITQAGLAQCVCPVVEGCPVKQDEVCASDTKTYVTECHMRVQACEEKTSLTVVKKGPCATCEEIQCDNHATCVTIDSQPKCQCPTKSECSTTADAVCGSDGKVYRNECYMKASSCEAGLMITVRNKGVCAQEDPCKGKECPLYSECSLDENGEARCTCIQGYPLIYNPVCASDGETYPNECVVNMRACALNGSLTILHEGHCTPCSTVTCQLYAKCATNNGTLGVCVCPNDCPSKPSPVCGSDGKSYHTECHLRHASCKRKVNVSVRHVGKCNPCYSKKCPPYAKCVSQFGTFAKCICPTTCSLALYDPTCGTDHKSYFNLCALQMTACHSNLTIRAAYKGTCGSPTTPCSRMRCPPNARCIVTTNGTAECACVKNSCPQSSGFVCGSNGKTYKSTCELENDSCEDNETIAVAHDGHCKTPCYKGKCKYGGHCERVTNTTARCKCRSCHFRYKPVCGTDKRSYINQCFLRRQACLTQTPISVARHGRCSCTSTRCLFGAKCELQEDGSESCQCPRSCRLSNDPVCGNNKKTYLNRCALDLDTCLTNGTVMLAHNGKCFLGCVETKCRFYSSCVERPNGQAVCICNEKCGLSLEPVCGSNGKTYINECFLRADACKQRRGFVVLQRGPCTPCALLKCDFYAECKAQLDGSLQCVCPKQCPLFFNPVCGSDGHTYPNQCTLQVESCKTQTRITVIKQGQCVCTGSNCPRRAKRSGGEVYRRLDISVGFKGDSYMKYKPLAQIKIKADIEMDFRPISQTGILLSNKASGRNRNNDYIFIILKRGRVIFSYDLGKGAALIVNDQRVRINEWNRLRAYRNGIVGYLEVNGVRVSGSSPAGLSHLNLDTDMYLGGGGIAQEIAAKYATLLTTRAGFFGSIKNLIINGQRYGLVFPGQLSDHPLEQRNAVMNSSFDLCMMTPCFNGGTCFVENEVKCRCPKGFLGNRCENRANTPYFKGGTSVSDSYIRFQPLVLSKDEFAAILDIRPEQGTGLIMYSGSAEDFISLAMKEGKLEFRFNLGKGKSIISTDFNLALNQWYHVEVIRVRLQGILIVNYNSIFRGAAVGTWTNLDLQQAQMYLGGGISVNQNIFQRTGVALGFTGCIREFETEDEELRESPQDLSQFVADANTDVRKFVEVKKCGCKDAECLNNGSCVERPLDFGCECRIGYTGRQCEILACGEDVIYDVGFAIDGSGSIDANEYRVTKDFVKDVIRIFTISETSTHVALLEYASVAGIKIYFDDYIETGELLEAVEELTQAQGGTTQIGSGLRKTLEMFTTDSGMREEVQKLFIFFTDGTNSNKREDLTPYTRQLKERGIKTFAVGVGSDTNYTELATIASSKDNVFKLEEFEELKYIIENLTPVQCKADGN